MRLITEKSNYVRYSKCHVLQPTNDYPVAEVRMDFEDFAALYNMDAQGLRGWLEKMLTIVRPEVLEEN